MVRRYSEFEIALALNHLRRGEPLSAVAKLQGIPERMIRLWALAFYDLTPAEIREARVLRAENRRLLARIRRLRPSDTGGSPLSSLRADCRSS